MEFDDQHSSLFRMACKAVKYFGIAVFGLILFCIMSSGLGAWHIAMLLLTSLGAWVGRLAVLIVGFLSAAVVYESLRQ